MESIWVKILKALSPFQISTSRSRPSPVYKVVFEVYWDLLLFFEQQEYTESPDLALEKAVTLTGSANNVQAITTGGYLF